jgi:hypothetical protein
VSALFYDLLVIHDSQGTAEKHDSTRAFVEMYNKGIKSVEDDEFQHLNQVTDDPVSGVLELDAAEDESGEEDEDDGEDEENRLPKEPETPLGPPRVR